MFLEPQQGLIDWPNIEKAASQSQTFAEPVMTGENGVDRANAGIVLLGLIQILFYC